MKIVLTAINSKYIHSNLAVYSLRAYAKEYEKDIEIAEYTINQQRNDILMDLYTKKADILCFSCYIWNISYVEGIVQELHKICPSTHIWLGGPEVSYDAKEVLKRLPGITGVMCGEGEETFWEIVENYHKGEQKWESIEGICYRKEDGSICQNPWRKAMDLNKVPFVYENIDSFKNKIIYYESSRGCPFSCSYCLSSVDKCLRFRDIEKVKKELKVFIEAEVLQVKFVDRTFNCNHKHCLEIWKFIKEQDRGITNFHFEVSADLLNEEELELITTMRPGLIQLEIGVQSTNQDTISEIHRTMKFEKVAECVGKIHKAGNIHQHLDLIAGLPEENMESFQNSFDEVYALQPEQLQLGFLKVLKGSYMEEHAGEYGLVYQSNPPYEVLCTKWISYDEIIALKQIEEMVEVYYNSGQFTHTMRELEKDYDSAFEMYRRISQYYLERELILQSHSRVGRYEILMDYISRYHKEKEGLLKQWMTFDFYLRENAKNRPAFAGEDMVSKEVSQAFYEKESKERNYLKGYEKYDKRQLRKMTHLEVLEIPLLGEEEEGKKLVLFDYINRDKLTHCASVFFV